MYRLRPLQSVATFASSKLQQPTTVLATRTMSTYDFTKTENLHANKLFDLSGWATVVTGGGTGIGLMCAQALVAK